MKKLNIIIIAHEFSPYQGSECAVGWNLVNEISRYHNVTVLYARTNQFGTSNYEEHVNDFYKKNGIKDSLSVISIPQSTKIALLIKINKAISPKNSSIGIPMLYFLCYKFWQKEVYNYYVSKSLNTRTDIIHQLTSISFREPGYLWNIDKPFFWGPISGNVKIPVTFFNILSFTEIIKESIRNIIVFIQLNYSIRVDSALKKADKVYCVTQNDFNHFNSKKKQNVEPMLDVGCFRSQISREKRSSKTKLNFIWIGRIVYSKALSIFLKSISIVNNTILNKEVHFIIIGEGPDLKKNKIHAEKLNINNLTWLGYLPHNEVLELLKKSDCLVHTSVREATSATILESLSFGVPVICHDAFGMAIAINDSCGIKIPFNKIDYSIVKFADAIIELINNSEQIDRLSLGAFKRSNELSWESMALKISNDYYKTYEKYEV
jgi:glycosyltransferase involved in cell wall biosynthesis